MLASCPCPKDRNDLRCLQNESTLVKNGNSNLEKMFMNAWFIRNMCILVPVGCFPSKIYEDTTLSQSSFWVSNKVRTKSNLLSSGLAKAIFTLND